MIRTTTSIGRTTATARRRTVTLQTKIVILTILLLAVVLAVTSVYFIHMFTATLEEHIGENALDVARTVAEMPEVKEALARGDSASSKVIQPLAEHIRTATEAEFVVIGDVNGIRYSHPVPERIGAHMVGGDNDQALAFGEAYVSVATGTLGRSMRGKVPVKDEQGNIVGIVSVGFLMKNIQEATMAYVQKIVLISLACLLAGIAGAVALARRIKRDIFGLEPVEIADLLRERNAMLKERSAILQSVREGLVAINQEGVITVANQAAEHILQVLGELIGRHIQAVIPNTRMLDVLATGERIPDEEMMIGSRLIVVNRVPIYERGAVIGAVSSFREKSDLDRVHQELSSIKRYA
ncbi:PAS domain-containing protein [Numidum massiliense]|uniref:PAS domain-containing protein n=1 Tax=Numidum massiliense TaxID=1522315 RepID=UPI0006D545EE|nr:sensor histidine kinase [Numidum massiliense]